MNSYNYNIHEMMPKYNEKEPRKVPKVIHDRTEQAARVLLKELLKCASGIMEQCRKL